MLRLIKIIAALSTSLAFANAARILGVFPYPSHSHQVVFRALTAELAERGHELTVFTTAPLNDPKLKNYTEVDLSFLNDGFKKKMNFFTTGNQGLWAFLHAVYEYGEVISDETLSHPAMQRLISPNSTEKFDLIIVQCLYYDAIYALSIRFNAPMIGVSSLPLFAVHHYQFGNPSLSAYSPEPFAGYTENMNFWERMVNAYYYLRQIYEYLNIIIPTQEKVVRKHFGDTVPHAGELSKNLSLLMVSTHPFFTYPRPNAPAIIQIGGFRSGKQKKDLPKDLKNILDNAKSGFIYFSLGSNVKSSQLPTEIQNTLLETFAELPYTVIWKFETDELPNKHNNIIIRKWLPQQEILAHPNAVLFVYQGGLQSTEEAIDNAVPMIGFPVFSDQISNVNKLQSIGAAKRLTLTELNRDTFKHAILEVITTPSYKKNILKLRDLLRDLPHHPMEQAVWWTEHVIRHKGAHHLRNRSRDLAWYQTHLVDIMAIVCLSIVLLVFFSFLIIRFVTKNLSRYIKRVMKWTVRTTKKQE